MHRRVETDIPVQSLCWIGDSLFDWVSGGVELWPEFGEGKGTDYSNGFDSAKASRNGLYVVLYQRLGVNGLILKNGKAHRDIYRDAYHAKQFDYPVELFSLVGRDVIAHCPTSYCDIIIQDLETGERLSPPPKEDDIFHSRLQASPSGNRLLSAGWIWHPYDAAHVYDCQALSQIYPLSGDSPLQRSTPPDEISAAVFLNESHLLIASSFEANGYDEPGDPRDFPATSIGVVDIESGDLLSVGGQKRRQARSWQSGRLTSSAFTTIPSSSRSQPAKSSSGGPRYPVELSSVV